jgi:hypothetical protein
MDDVGLTKLRLLGNRATALKINAVLVPPVPSACLDPKLALCLFASSGQPSAAMAYAMHTGNWHVLPVAVVLSACAWGRALKGGRQASAAGKSAGRRCQCADAGRKGLSLARHARTDEQDLWEKPFVCFALEFLDLVSLCILFLVLLLLLLFCFLVLFFCALGSRVAFLTREKTALYISPP